MDCCSGAGGCHPALLQQGDDFSGKGRKGGQAAQKTGNDHEPPFAGQIGVLRKKCHRQSDQESACQVGCQGTRRNCRKKSIQGKAKKPPQQRTHGCPDTDGKNGRKHVVLPFRFRKIAADELHLPAGKSVGIISPKPGG